jgi:N5-(cytidine 5'-diphosphoramidyl)-L-glutamine hydrolase
LKKIIVTQRVDYIKNYKEVRDSLDQRLSKLLVGVGFAPVPISNKLVIIDKDIDVQQKEQPVLQKWLENIIPDALLISGGNDIGVLPYRDATEHYLLNWAKAEKIPVLGICRGLQSMCVWSGGSLVRVKNHVATRHKLKTCNSGDLWPGEVNSFHEWGLANCPTNFEVKATTEDGVIEAIKHKELPWEGWMWHPERNHIFDNTDLHRIRTLFSLS